MDVETVRMSSKGQIVIPQDTRNELGIGEGTVFAIFGSDDTIILKKVDTPSKEKLMEDLGNIAKIGRARLEKLGVKEKDIPKIVGARRK
ncbi:MAG: AbrB/MazE/SpoVT family DNA-binding domain-containing protein [Candidatus Woesearchaeota archaeon]